MNTISISKDTFLPSSSGYDLRYDSSASDEIRSIWAFTLSLLLANKGNHPGLLIYDEPKQHSMVDKDFKVFCNKICKMKSKAQIIIGITVKEVETKQVIESLDRDSYHLINTGNLAFKRM